MMKQPDTDRPIPSPSGLLVTKESRIDFELFRSDSRAVVLNFDLRS